MRTILLDDSQRGISANLCVHLRARTGSVEVATMGSCVRKSASALFGLVGLQTSSANQADLPVSGGVSEEQTLARRVAVARTWMLAKSGRPSESERLNILL